jgi:hypothetical protein
MINFDENEHPRVIDGTFTDKVQSKPELTISRGQYADKTPPEIDVVLARYSSEVYELNEHIYLANHRLREGERLAAELERTGRRERFQPYLSASDVTRIEESIAKYEGKRAGVQLLIDPIDEEFAARGGWTRFFITTGSNPHVHSHMGCSTCYPRTRFGWLTDHSGMSEEEIVELAGDEACTVCFPTAPVADRNAPRQNQLETPEGRVARVAREEEKAAREAKKIASSIAMPDGDHVYDDHHQPFKTERAAELAAMEGLSNRVWYDNHPSAPEWNIVTANAEVAIAAKRSITVPELRETWMKKLQAKAKRDGFVEKLVEKAPYLFNDIDAHHAARRALEDRWDKISLKPNKSAEELMKLSELATEIDRLSGKPKPRAPRPPRQPFRR